MNFEITTNGSNSDAPHSHNFQDLTGRRFSRLVVMSFAYTKRGCAFWNCLCDCGNEVTVLSSNLKSGNTKSCGCLNVEKWGTQSFRHGDCNSRLYRIYSNMKDRCCRLSHRDFSKYGGRGITVCDEWEASYLRFKQWAIENGYDDTLTIDRIDVNGNYEPSNCRWVNMVVQNNNRRSNRLIDYRGETKPLSAWCRELGLKYGTVWARLSKYGYDVERAFEGR